ncbi:MAG: isoprenylcysteine carboxylmethyltransferase family protein [Pyrinomonadaceae bacterium]
MTSLFVRNLFFTILQPGVVTILLPFLILRTSDRGSIPDSLGWPQWIGAATVFVGVSIMASCIIRFATEGKGTISPLDPTKKLVLKGLYRYSRNPMYVGAMLLLVGEATFWMSALVALYAAVVFLAFNLFIILHEEPRLRREFASEYESYLGSVRRWL